MDFIVITRYGIPKSDTKGYCAAKQSGYAPSIARIRSRKPYGGHIDYIISAKLTLGLYMPLPSRPLG